LAAVTQNFVYPCALAFSMSGLHCSAVALYVNIDIRLRWAAVSAKGR
jgi:hypothetical protein